jgi:hypothetical protein
MMPWLNLLKLWKGWAHLLKNYVQVTLGFQRSKIFYNVFVVQILQNNNQLKNMVSKQKKNQLITKCESNIEEKNHL